MGDTKHGLFGCFDGECAIEPDRRPGSREQLTLATAPRSLLRLPSSGHGKQGEKASQFVIENLPKILSEQAEIEQAPAQALKKAFVEVDKALGKHMDASVSGTTAVCALMRGDTMWVANAGDSRAIVARRGPKDTLVTHDLTQDQKPDTPAEKARIERMGGRVSAAAADGTPVARAPQPEAP